jgi:hypothetical protein
MNSVEARSVSRKPPSDPDHKYAVTNRVRKAAARAAIAEPPVQIDRPEGRPTYTPPKVKGWPQWAGKMLKALSQTGNVRSASYGSGLAGPKHAYVLRKKDPLFAEEWKKALGVATWEAETTHRFASINGWVERTVKKDRDGNVIEVVEKSRFSPRMLERQLAVNDPERWGNKSQVEVNRTDTINVVGVQKMIADPRIAQLVCDLDEAMAAPAPVTRVEALPSPAAVTHVSRDTSATTADPDEHEGEPDDEG